MWSCSLNILFFTDHVHDNFIAEYGLHKSAQIIGQVVNMHHRNYSEERAEPNVTRDLSVVNIHYILQATSWFNFDLIYSSCVFIVFNVIADLKTHFSMKVV